MYPSDFYEITNYPKLEDKYDKLSKKFDYYDMIDFAQRYHDNEIKPFKPCNSHPLIGKEVKYKDKIWKIINVHDQNRDIVMIDNVTEHNLLINLTWRGVELL